MKREKGKLTLGGTISYCSQQAWIQNATVRETAFEMSDQKSEELVSEANKLIEEGRLDPENER